MNLLSKVTEYNHHYCSFLPSVFSSTSGFTEMLPSAGLLLGLLVVVLTRDRIPDEGERAGEELGLTSVVVLLLKEWSL